MGGGDTTPATGDEVEGSPFADGEPTPDPVSPGPSQRVVETLIADGAGGTDGFRCGGIATFGWEPQFGVAAGAGGPVGPGGLFELPAVGVHWSHPEPSICAVTLRP